MFLQEAEISANALRWWRSCEFKVVTLSRAQSQTRERGEKNVAKKKAKKAPAKKKAAKKK